MTFSKNFITLQPLALNMPQENDLLRKLQTRVRQLILLLQETKDENVRLREALKEKDDETIVLQQQLAQAKADYEHLKSARMMEISYGDISQTKTQITKLIKDLNKAITLLNAE